MKTSLLIKLLLLSIFLLLLPENIYSQNLSLDTV